MKALWAPWRMDYILENKPDNNECIFCSKSKADDDLNNYIICREKYCFALLNIYPYNNGHIMITPYRHVSSLTDLNTEELNEFMQLTKDMVTLLQKTIHPQGFNIGINLGEIAGAGIACHLHQHIVPRWHGDTNFMPIIGSTKVIPQALKKMYTMLKTKQEEIIN